MKKLYALCISAFLIMSAPAQIFFKHFDPATKKEGTKDADGNILIPAVYNFLMRTGPDLFIAKLDKKFGLISGRNVTVHPFEWDTYQKVSGPHALYVVTTKNKKGLLNRTGVILPAQYDEIHYTTTYNRNFIQVSNNKKHGYIDTLGNVRIPLMYEKTNFFIKGLAAMMKQGKWGLVDTLNKVRLPFNYDCCFATLASATDAIVAYRNGKVGVIDVKGTIILPHEYDNVKSAGIKGFFAVKKNNKYGLIDSLGKLVIPVLNDTFVKRQPGYVWLFQNSKWGAIDSAAKIKIDFKYQWIGEWKDGFLPIMVEGKGGYLDATLKEKISPQFDGVGNFSNNLAWVSKDKLIGQIRSDGSFNWPLQFEGAKLYEDHYAIVKKDGKVGIINPEGKMLLPLNYDFIGFNNTKALFEHYYIPVSRNNKVGMIQSDGKIVIAVDYYNVLAVDQYFLAQKNKGDRQVSVFDERGTWLQYKTLSSKEVDSFNRD